MFIFYCFFLYKKISINKIILYFIYWKMKKIKEYLNFLVDKQTLRRVVPYYFSISLSVIYMIIGYMIIMGNFGYEIINFKLSLNFSSLFLFSWVLIWLYLILDFWYKKWKYIFEKYIKDNDLLKMKSFVIFLYWTWLYFLIFFCFIFFHLNILLIILLFYKIIISILCLIFFLIEILKFKNNNISFLTLLLLILFLVPLSFLELFFILFLVHS